MLWLVFGAVLLAGLFSVRLDRKDKKRGRALDIAMRDALSSENLKADKVLKSGYGNTALAIDSHANELVFVAETDKKGFYKYHYYGPGSVIDAEVLSEFETTHTSKRRGQVGRAVVGGLALGGVGAVLGAVTAQTKHDIQTNISAVTLAITVSDVDDPMIVIPLASTDKRVADLWCARVRALAHRTVAAQ